MKKILILTYFFPPASFTASSRVFSWAKYLNEFGYYPIFVTRRWDVEIKNYRDMSRSSGKEVEHEVNEKYEVYKLPYKGSLRDRLYAKYGDKKHRIFRKILSVMEVLLSNFSIRILPYSNLYYFTDKLLTKDSKIVIMLASGQPFTLFEFCHRLNRKHNIPWIADYRDDWNTSQWMINPLTRLRLYKRIESLTEQKWLSTADHFITVSEYYVEQIGKFVNKPGTCVMNGYDEDDYAGLLDNKPADDFTIIFNGTLYETQPVDVFTSAYKTFINNLPKEERPKLIFLGVGFDKIQTNRIRNLLRGFESYFEITNRIEKRDALIIMSQAHVFLMFAHTGIKGVSSSKVFDYIALRKPILLCPEDHDILDEVIVGSGAGAGCNNEKEVLDFLSKSFNEFKLTGTVSCQQNFGMTNQYTRRHQTGVLASVLDKIAPDKETLSCTRCVLTSKDHPEIHLDKNGVCDICHTFDELKEREVLTGEFGISKLNTSLNEIRHNLAGKKYDCIIGISGGVDSSYLVYKAKEWGLRPLLVHVDGGWNTEIAVDNIKNLLHNTGFDLYTHVLDWEQIRNAQKAFIRANVLDIDLPFDNAFIAVLYQQAKKWGIKHILVGHNIITEGFLPPGFTHYKPDTMNIRSIFRKFGVGSLKGFPLLGPIGLWWYEKILGIRFVYPLNWIDYDRETVKEIIKRKLNWREYGSKHCENIFTRFYQCYILYYKFGVDKRKSHLQTLICAGQKTKDQALEILHKSEPYESAEMCESDKNFFLKKLQITQAEFDAYMLMPEIPHTRYRSYVNIYNYMRPTYRFFKSLVK